MQNGDDKSRREGWAGFYRQRHAPSRLTWPCAGQEEARDWLGKERVAQALVESSMKRDHRGDQKGHFWMQLPDSGQQMW